MRLPTLSILICLSSCAPLITVTADESPNQLPVINGFVSFHKVDVEKGIRLDEFYRAARGWFRENKDSYSLEWEKPVYETTLVHSAIIPASRIGHDQADYYSKRTVRYLITVEAIDDTCRIYLSNFEVLCTGRHSVELERLSTDKELCESVNRESLVLIESLSNYIRKNTEKK